MKLTFMLLYLSLFRALAQQECANFTINSTEIIELAPSAEPCTDICTPVEGSCVHCESVGAQGLCVPLDIFESAEGRLCCTVLQTEEGEICGVQGNGTVQGPTPFVTNFSCHGNVQAEVPPEEECLEDTINLLEIVESDFAEIRCGEICRPINGNCSHCSALDLDDFCFSIDEYNDKIAPLCCDVKTRPDVEGEFCGVTGESGDLGVPIANFTCTTEESCLNDTISLDEFAEEDHNSTECGAICLPQNGSCAHCGLLQVDDECFDLDPRGERLLPFCCSFKTREDIDGVFCGVTAQIGGSDVINLTCNEEATEPPTPLPPPVECNNDTLEVTDFVDENFTSFSCEEICFPAPNGDCSHCFSVQIDELCFSLDEVNEEIPLCCSLKTREDIGQEFCGITATDIDEEAGGTNLTCSVEPPTASPTTSGIAETFYIEHIQNIVMACIFVLALQYN